MLHHGVEDGEDVGEDGGNSQKERDKGTVGFRFFVYVYETLGFGPLKNEGVEEVGIDHRFERAMITTIMTRRFARTYWAVLQITMTINVNGSHMVNSCQKG